MTKCVTHDKKLDILCSDCNLVICYRCLTSNYIQHRILHTDDIKQLLLDRLLCCFKQYLINQQINNEIIAYLNNNNEINKNNDNIKTNNSNVHSILQIIRNHFEKYKIDINQIGNMNYRPLTFADEEPFYLYFYGKERVKNINGKTVRGNNMILRYNVTKG
ncbi:hypothetical protein PPL_05396 [Heterostelium album PN500]|uniref:B box-type domain-containing protein n=1 Tax=Heterostelium pallidum (strain ATCC 26659 / Pp 5 / PN500) TaxID=670386 RepID=D3BA24_HETP5|nr:hypothetical protein PPL_05396 [Heterostelium album PN500]EFA81411.1 hypothetical protein PPL_05396 [Heterostelium album PN500]|eukprot:XP_020433529.1 hypothetical protein PPL_05396 [Heterostelium album PN500]